MYHLESCSPALCQDVHKATKKEKPIKILNIKKIYNVISSF